MWKNNIICMRSKKTDNLVWRSSICDDLNKRFIICFYNRKQCKKMINMITVYLLNLFVVFTSKVGAEPFAWVACLQFIHTLAWVACHTVYTQGTNCIYLYLRLMHKGGIQSENTFTTLATTLNIETCCT